MIHLLNPVKIQAFEHGICQVEGSLEEGILVTSKKLLSLGIKVERFDKDKVVIFNHGKIFVRIGTDWDLGHIVKGEIINTGVVTEA